jgi:hypothetical protein
MTGYASNPEGRVERHLRKTSSNFRIGARRAVRNDGMPLSHLGEPAGYSRRISTRQLARTAEMKSFVLAGQQQDWISDDR